jgi:excisionase family DNA binding protein
VKREVAKTSTRPGARAQVTSCVALPEGEEFFTKPEIAKLMKVSIRTVTEMMNRGEIAYLKIGERLVRFRLEDVQRCLSAKCLHPGIPTKEGA